MISQFLKVISKQIKNYKSVINIYMCSVTNYYKSAKLFKSYICMLEICQNFALFKIKKNLTEIQSACFSYLFILKSNLKHFQEPSACQKVWTQISRDRRKTKFPTVYPTIYLPKSKFWIQLSPNWPSRQTTSYMYQRRYDIHRGWYNVYHMTSRLGVK